MNIYIRQYSILMKVQTYLVTSWRSEKGNQHTPPCKQSPTPPHRPTVRIPRIRHFSFFLSRFPFLSFLFSFLFLFCIAFVQACFLASRGITYIYILVSTRSDNITSLLSHTYSPPPSWSWIIASSAHRIASHSHCVRHSYYHVGRTSLSEQTAQERSR